MSLILHASIFNVGYYLYHIVKIEKNSILSSFIYNLFKFLWELERLCHSSRKTQNNFMRWTLLFLAFLAFRQLQRGKVVSVLKIWDWNIWWKVQKVERFIKENIQRLLKNRAKIRFFSKNFENWTSNIIYPVYRWNNIETDAKKGYWPKSRLILKNPQF